LDESIQESKYALKAFSKRNDKEKKVDFSAQ